jgi:hypothetical protein
MFMSKLALGAVVIIGISAAASTPLIRPAQAEVISAHAGPGSQQHLAATDVSARRRYVRRGYRNYAGAAAAGLIIGTAGAIIANEQRREYRRQYVQPYYGQPNYGQYGGGYVSSPYDRYGNYRQCGNGYYGYGCGDD